MPKVRSDDGLSFKERAFAKEFSKSLNATQSAKKVYKVGNSHSANVLGSKVLKRLVKVGGSQGISGFTEVLKEKLTPDWILGNLVKLAGNSRRDADKIRALELLGKFSELSLWRDYQVQEEIQYTPETEADLDAEYMKLIEEKKSIKQ
ncbi:MAG: hypothetical protein ABIH50_00115 [bacterium]